MSTVDVEALRSSLDLVDVVARYVQLTKMGAEFRALCPFHDDHSPSLTVHQGKQVWACFACGAHETYGADLFGFVRSYENCTFPEALERLQNGAGGNGSTPPKRTPLKKPPTRRVLPHPDGEQPDMAHRELGEPVKVWTIRTRDGTPWFYEARYMVDGKKETRFWTYGQYTTEPAQWECRHPTNPRPFYGLEQLDLMPAAQVMIHEAPKKAEAARVLFPAQAHLGMLGGAHQAGNMDVSELKGRRCILLPDNDPAGLQAMERLAVRLWEAGAVEVKGINPETQPEGSLSPEGWDIADAQGWTPAIALSWAQARKTIYPDHAAPAAGQGSEPPPSAPASGAAPSQDAPERAASASAVPPTQPLDKRPKAQPRLGVVDGSAIRAPRQEIEAEADQLPAFSEFALAARFADSEGHDWRYTAAWNVWARWMGFKWEPDEVRAITWKVKDCCTAAMREHLNESTPSQRMKITTLKTVNAVASIAGADPRIAVTAGAWDADPMLMGTPSGVIDLTTGQLVAASREQMISKATSVCPMPGPHPWWDKVLDRAHRGDAQMAAFIQRWCGYMLTGDTREERFLFIHGPGAGGKSKFIEPLSEILADYRCVAKMESFTAKDRSEHSEEIARLAGSRLVTATETAEGSRWNESRITALTGRDLIAARHMHKSTFHFKPQFKLVFIGNHRPALRSVGEEMRRRIDLIEWGGTIPEKDRILDLPERLRAEYPAILAWMIEGCLAWQREGLGKPAAVSAATGEYVTSEDTLGAWLEECTETGERAPAGESYRSFARWAEAAGEFVPSQKRFTQSLRDRGFDTVKAGVRYFTGFRLKADDRYPETSESWVPD